MKSLKLAFLALFLLNLALVSCKKSSNPKPKVNNSLSFKFNGTSYSTSNITAVDSAGYLQVVGVINNSTIIDLITLNSVKVGAFDMASGAATATFDSGSTNLYDATSGTLTITSFTGTTVAGNFSFTATNLLTEATGTATSGTFQTAYTIKN